MFFHAHSQGLIPLREFFLGDGPGDVKFSTAPLLPLPPSPNLNLDHSSHVSKEYLFNMFHTVFLLYCQHYTLKGKKTKQYEIYPSWKWLISTVALFSLKWPCVAVWCCKIVASLVLFPRFSKLIDAPFLLCQKSKIDWIAHTKHISCVWFHRLILILIKGSVTVRHVCAYLFTIFICTFQLWNPFYMIVQVFKT